jgi:hypothetical protein
MLSNEKNDILTGSLSTNPRSHPIEGVGIGDSATE